MPPAGFEPAIPAGERPQTHALGREASLIVMYIHTQTDPRIRGLPRPGKKIWKIKEINGS